MYTNLTLIAAMSHNGVIGNGATIPWNIPTDMKHFKTTTMGHVVIMGWKTYESLGRKALVGRTNIVLTRFGASRGVTDDAVRDSAGTRLLFAADIPSAMKLAEKYSEGQEIFCIGGAQIYAAMIDDASKLIITHVQTQSEGNCKFPTIDHNVWVVEEIVSYPECVYPILIKTYIRP